MEKKLAELTDKIYREGVEKGEKEKKDIIEASAKEAAKIEDDARKKAEKIIANAEKKAADLKRNCESDLRLSSTQAINALKQQIIDIVSSKILDDDVKDAMNGKEVLESCIVEIANNWNDRTQSLEVLLSDENKNKLSKSLECRTKEVLDASITLNVSKNIASGFKIGPEGGTYKLSLTDDDFSEFFKEFLRPATRKLLFDE